MSRKWCSNSVWLIKVFILIALFTSSADAAILYVDKDNACPGAGTDGNPYCSIANAEGAVAAGDTIRIRDAASAYSETITTTKFGTSDGVRITVEPDTGHNPTLRNAGAGGDCATFYLKGVAYWTIQNLNFDATGVNPCKFGAIWAQSGWAGGDTASVKILNNTFKGWGGPTGEPSTTAMNAVIISGGISGPLEGTWPTNTVVEGNTFDSNRTYSLVLSHTDGTIVRGNEFVNQKCGRGQDAVNQVGMHVIFTNKNLLITENDFHDDEDRASCTLTTQGFATETAIWCDVGQWQATVVTNNEISRNRIWNLQKDKNDYSNPNGLSHSTRGMFIEADCAGFTVKNNLIWDIGNIGITNAYHSLNGSAPANNYYNNTIYSNGIYGFQVKSGNVVVKNNIISNNSTAQICRGACSEDGDTAIVSLTADYNFYNDGAGQTLIGRVSGTDYTLANWKTNCGCGDAAAITGNPLFTNAGSADFTLLSTSTAINAGTTISGVTNDFAGVSRPQSSAYDMGAYEFTGSFGTRRRLSAVTNLNGQVATIAPGIANVSLGWTDPNTAPDQSEDGTAVNREVAGTFVQVGAVGPNATQFSESFSASAGSQQCYVVQPFYNDGLDGADPSNEWCGTVPPCNQKGNSGKCR
jgi:hypothetical protein